MTECLYGYAVRVHRDDGHLSYSVVGPNCDRQVEWFVTRHGAERWCVNLRQAYRAGLARGIEAAQRSELPSATGGVGEEGPAGPPDVERPTPA